MFLHRFSAGQKIASAWRQKAHNILFLIVLMFVAVVVVVCLFVCLFVCLLFFLGGGWKGGWGGRWHPLARAASSRLLPDTLCIFREFTSIVK